MVSLAYSTSKSLFHRHISGTLSRATMENSRLMNTGQHTLCCSLSEQNHKRESVVEANRPVLLFDVMDTIVHDPFYTIMPQHFGLTFEQVGWHFSLVSQIRICVSI